MTSQIDPHILLAEAKLAFHPYRQSDRDIHPLRGLIRFGPHSSGSVPAPMRVATIAPAGDAERLYAFMNELKVAASPRERREYLPQWPGFHGVFGIHLRAAPRHCHIELAADTDDEMQRSGIPHLPLVERLTRAIQGLEVDRAAFDVLFIYLPQRWEGAFYGLEEEDFDLHDHIKAITAVRRIPVQMVREDKALAYPDRAS